MLRYILPGIAVFIALFAFLLFSCKIPLGSCGGAQDKGPTGDLVLWGTLPSEAVNPTIQALTTSNNAHYTIAYTEIPERNFNNALLNALASGKGPDMILADYKTLLSQSERINPFPLSSFSANDYRNAYVDGAALLLTNNGALALPVSVEPLVLFTNRTLLSKHGVAQAPTTWDDMLAVVPNLTVKDVVVGKFLESAIALGATNNISNAKDVVMTLVQELAQTPVSTSDTTYEVTADTPIVGNESVHPLTSSVQLFTQFSNARSQVYTWNSLQDDAESRFIAGGLAMYLGYSGELLDMQKKNGHLDIGIGMFPQAKGYNTQVTGMKLYGIATLKRTTLLDTAFTAEAALAGSQYGPQIASAGGGITPLKAVLGSDASLDASLKKSALIARGWYDINSDTSSSYFAGMIDDVTSGRKELSDAVNDFVNSLQTIYRK